MSLRGNLFPNLPLRIREIKGGYEILLLTRDYWLLNTCAHLSSKFGIWILSPIITLSTIGQV
jgi:hypothetical protein